MNLKPSASSRTEIRRFLFSDVQDELLVVYQKMVETLGGITVSTTKNTFTSTCTHVITRTFSYTEKVLCALAGGKWVLQEDFLRDSSKAGHWLDERKYELPDYDEVAQYCRIYRSDVKKGFFSGKTIYIKLSNQAIAKSFRRIVTEGDAVAVSSENSMNADLAITDLKTLIYVRPLVRPGVPIVTISYLKNTLLMRGDPSNFRPYLLNDPGNDSINGTPSESRYLHPGGIGHKQSASESPPASNLSSIKHYHHSSTDVCGSTEDNGWRSSPGKRPLLEAYHMNDNDIDCTSKKCHSPKEPERSYVQKLDCSILSPKDNGVSSKAQINNVINTRQKRKYNRIPFSPSAYHNIKFYFSPSSRSENQEARKSQGSLYQSSHLDQPVTRNSSSSGSKNFHSNHRMPEWSERRANDSQKHPKPNISPKKAYERVERNIPRSVPCINEISRNDCNVENSSQKPLKPARNESHRKAHERRIESSYPKPSEPSRNQSPGKANNIRQNGTNIGDRCKHALFSANNQDHLKSGTEQKEDEIISGNSNVKDSTSKCSDVQSHELALSNVNGIGSSPSHMISKIRPKSFNNLLTKEVRVELLRLEDQYRLSEKCITSLISGKSIRLKNSSAHKPLENTPITQIISEEDIKSGIVKFIRRSKTQDNTYCGNIQCLHMECSPGNCAMISEASKDSSHQRLKVRELSLQETCHYESTVEPDSSTFREEGIIAYGLDSLWLSITPTTYPSAWLLGHLLRKLVLETKLDLIHHQGLSLAHQMLLLHPPATPAMKTYYLTVIETAAQDIPIHGSNRVWGFVLHVIDLLNYWDMDHEGDSMDNIQSVIVNHALHVLQFLVILLRLDLKYYVTGNSMRQLLIWNMFLGPARHLYNATPPMKQLLQRWVNMHLVPPAGRHCLAQLVSLLIEMAWRFSTTTLFPPSPIPQSLSAIGTELIICLKDSGPSTVDELMRELPSPWIKAVVGAIIFREVTQSPNKPLVLSNLMDYFYAANVQQKGICSKDSHKMSVGERPYILKKLRLNLHTINKQNCKGETALMRACIKENAKHVQLLLTVPGVDVNKSDYSGWTPLHEAAIRGNETILKLLLSFNCFDNLEMQSFLNRDHCSKIVNAQARGGEDNRTPLHDAVENDHQEVARLLLDYGGKVLLEDKDIDGKTAVDMAQNMEMLNMLNSYKSKSSKEDSFTKFHKPAIISSGLGLPTGLLPSCDDRIAFIIKFANSYLEVSGGRCVIYSVRREKNIEKNSPSQKDSRECVSTSEVLRERNSNLDSASKKRKWCSEEQLTPKSSLYISDAELCDRIYEYMRVDLTTYKELLEAEEVNQNIDNGLEQLKYLLL